MLWSMLLAACSCAAMAQVLEKMCDSRGLSEDPLSCWQGSPPRYLPNVFGGPATLDQCVFGHPKPQQGIFGKGGSCSSGALFGFSGTDGQTNSRSKMFGWFVNGSYSVHLWLNVPRLLRLGFGDDASADPSKDDVLVATNDVLVVQRDTSSIGVTWRDWSTIVGFVEGPAARAVALEERVCDTAAGGCTHHTPPYAIRAVNTSTIGGQSISVSAFTTKAGVTTFAVCYSLEAHSAESCAAQAAASVDVGAVLAERNKYITESLPPLADPGDDRFQRKLLSVMKVNSLSPEGLLKHSWSSADRVADYLMYAWDGMMQTMSMNAVDPELALEYIRGFLQMQNETSGQMCSQVSPDGTSGKGGCSTNAMPPNIAITTWDNYLRGPNKTFIASTFPWLERYIEWDMTNRRGPSGGPVKYLLRWDNAGGTIIFIYPPRPGPRTMHLGGEKSGCQA